MCVCVCVSVCMCVCVCKYLHFYLHAYIAGSVLIAFQRTCGMLHVTLCCLRALVVALVAANKMRNFGAM